MTDHYYPVEKIIGKKCIKNKVIYKVKWQGFPIQQSTWQKAASLKNVWDLVEKYEQQQLEENSHASSFSNFERSKKFEQNAKNVSSNLRPSRSKKRLNGSFAQESVQKPVMRQRKNPQMSDTNVLNMSVYDEMDQNSKNTIDFKKAANMIEKVVDDNLNQKKKRKRKEKTPKFNQTAQEKPALHQSVGNISELLYENFQQKQDLSRCSFETPTFKVSYSNRKDEVSPQNNDKSAQNIFKQTTQRLQNEENAPQISHINNENKTSGLKVVGQIQPKNIVSNSFGVQVSDKDKEDKKSVQTVSSQSSLCKSLHERLLLKSEDNRVGSIRIRLLDYDDEEKGDIKDYLIQYEDGSMKIFSSIQLIIEHPLEFVVYLQGKAYGKKK